MNNPFKKKSSGQLTKLKERVLALCSAAEGSPSPGSADRVVAYQRVLRVVELIEEGKL